MRITDKGLVLFEVKLREHDRILTLLTQNHGILSVSAKGSLRPSSRLFSASGLYCYSEWTLYQGKKMYSVDEASPIEVFFGLRENIEGIALAAYMAEILRIFSPGEDEGSRLLKLTLNCLYMLSHGKRDARVVKTVFELRAMAESGYMPDVLACRSCGKYDGGDFLFDTSEGFLLCGDCAEERGLLVNIGPAALLALRYIVLSDTGKVFDFTLKGDSILSLSRIAEGYLLEHTDYAPKTLPFLQSIL